MDLEKITPLLQTSKPLEIFKKLVAFNEATLNHSEKVSVRIGLSSGFILEGVPLKMDVDHNAIFTSTTHSISFINVYTLAGVEILNPEVVIEILTGGSYFEVPENAIPTNLQLKRAFKLRGDKLENNYGIHIQSELLEKGLSTEAEKYQFEQFLNLLQETLDTIAQDSLGKEALNELQELSINSGEGKLFMEKKNTLLAIDINFNNKFSTDFKDHLKAAFESNL